MTEEPGAPEKVSVGSSTPSKLKRAWIWSFAILLVVAVLHVLVGYVYKNLGDKGWTTYTSEDSGLVDDQVNALAIDEGGRIWVGTERGLSVLAPDGSWTTYTSEDSGLVGNNASALAIDGEGRVWVGTSGVSRALNTGEGEDLVIPSGLFGGLSVLAPDGNWTSYTLENSGLVYDFVAGLAIDKEGRAWVGTQDAGLSVLSPDGSWTTYPPEKSGIGSGHAKALAIDDEGRVWVGIPWDGSGGGGLRVLAPDGIWTTYTSENSGLVMNFVRVLAIDEEGRAWVGTEYGLSVLAPDGIWTTYISEELLSNRVEALYIDEGGRVWVGTFNGLRVLAPEGSWTTYTSDDSGLASAGVQALAIDDEGRVWVGSDAGLRLFDERASTSRSVLKTIADVVSVLRLGRDLAIATFVILSIGAVIRRIRKPSKARAPEPTPVSASDAAHEQPVTSSGPASRLPSDPEIALAEGKELLSRGETDKAVAHLMHAFREGSPEIRREAINHLEELGEMKGF